LKTLSLSSASKCIWSFDKRFSLSLRWFSSCVLFLAGIFLTMEVSSPIAFGATPAKGPAASAASMMGRDVQLNGVPMPSGATLFAGDVIHLGEESTAALRFGSSLVLAAPLTEMVVDSEGVSLGNGRLQARTNGTESFAVSGAFFRVRLAAEGGLPNSTEIRVEGARAQITAVAGDAEVTAAGSTTAFKLHAGETATLDDTGQSSNNKKAAAAGAGARVPIIITVVGVATAVGIGVWQATRPTVSISIP
jgi:hypothetical protein